jgi:hypothetical protein
MQLFVPEVIRITVKCMVFSAISMVVLENVAFYIPRINISKERQEVCMKYCNYAWLASKYVAHFSIGGLIGLWIQRMLWG